MVLEPCWWTKSLDYVDYVIQIETAGEGAGKAQIWPEGPKAPAASLVL